MGFKNRYFWFSKLELILVENYWDKAEYFDDLLYL